MLSETFAPLKCSSEFKVQLARDNPNRRGRDESHCRALREAGLWNAEVHLSQFATPIVYCSLNAADSGSAANYRRVDLRTALARRQVHPHGSSLLSWNLLPDELS